MKEKNTIGLWRRVWKNRRNIFIFIGLVILLDFAMRIPFPNPEYTYFETKEIGTWAEDPELFWLHGHYFVDEIRLMRKTPSDKLVYAFGGSILTSHNTLTNFPEELGKCLAPDMTVINFATGGYTSYQSLVLFQRMIERKKPSVAIICHATNDSANAPRSDRQSAERNRKLSAQALYVLSKSRIVSALRQIFKKDQDFDPYSLDNQGSLVRRVDHDDFEKNMKAFARIAKQKQIELVFLSQAASDKANYKNLAPYFEIMKRAAAPYSNVHYLDIRPAFYEKYNQAGHELPKHFGQDLNRRFFVDWCHLSDYSHIFFGKEICAYLKAKKLAPGSKPES